MDAVIRAFDVVEKWPDWLRPAAYGPMLVASWMTMKGALVAGPVLLAIGLVTSDAPVSLVLSIAIVFGIVFGSSALGGLAYGIVGRFLANRLPLGWVIAGWVSVFPYFCGLVLVLRLKDETAIWSPFQVDDWVVVIMMTVIFGTQIGYMLIREA